mgnify:CR=1 FL=1
MFSYATLGSNDLDKSVAFYLELLKEQGAKTLIKMDRIVFIGKSMQSPMLAVCIPYNKEAATPGNGTMLSIAPGSKEKVDEMTEHFRNDGFEVLDGPRTTGDGYYESVILDPEKNRIELTV